MNRDNELKLLRLKAQLTEDLACVLRMRVELLEVFG